MLTECSEEHGRASLQLRDIAGEVLVLTPSTVITAYAVGIVVTMVAAFVGGAVGGIPGALVATPLVGAAKQLILDGCAENGYPLRNLK